MYWANFDGGKISFARLDGAGGADLDTTGATPFTHAIGVAIDRGANRIYWAKYDSPVGVSYASLDGTGGGNLNTTGATLEGPATPALLKAPGAGGFAGDHGSDHARVGAVVLRRARGRPTRRLVAPVPRAAVDRLRVEP